MKVLIQYNVVANYRIEFFSELAKIHDIEVLYSKELPGRNALKSYPKISGFSHTELGIKKYFGRFFWQKGLLARVVRTDAEIIVFLGDVWFLSTVLAFFIAKLRRKKIGWWTQVLSVDSRRIGFWIRKLFFRMSDIVFAYYEEEKKYLPYSIAKKTIGIGNTQGSINGSGCDSKARSNSGHILKLVTIGRLIPKMNLSLVIDALSMAKGMGAKCDLHVIGGGVDAPMYQSQALKLNISDHVIWHGEIYDEKEIGRIMSDCHLFVYGGAVGLSLIHAFSYGLPGLIHDKYRSHNPEALMLKSGVNGILFSKDSASDLANKIYMCSKDLEGLDLMGQNAQKLVKENLGIKRMVDRFSNGLLSSVKK